MQIRICLTHSNAVLTTNRQNSAWPGLPECCDHKLQRKKKQTTHKKRTTAPLYSWGDQEDGFAQPDKAGWNSKSKATMKSLGMPKLVRAFISAWGFSQVVALPRESHFRFQVTVSTCGHLWDILWPHIQNKCHPVPHRNLGQSLGTPVPAPAEWQIHASLWGREEIKART